MEIETIKKAQRETIREIENLGKKSWVRDTRDRRENLRGNRHHRKYWQKSKKKKKCKIQIDPNPGHSENMKPKDNRYRRQQRVLSLASSLGNKCSVQWMAVSIYFCICQALAEPPRRELYQVPVSKHLLASTIVFGFGDCIWDGSPGGAVSGWSFLQSLLHTLFL